MVILLCSRLEQMRPLVSILYIRLEQVRPLVYLHQSR
jgi:hypothetical protein